MDMKVRVQYSELYFSPNLDGGGWSSGCWSAAGRRVTDRIFYWCLAMFGTSQSSLLLLSSPSSGQPQGDTATGVPNHFFPVATSRICLLCSLLPWCWQICHEFCMLLNWLSPTSPASLVGFHKVCPIDKNASGHRHWGDQWWPVEVMSPRSHDSEVMLLHFIAAHRHQLTLHDLVFININTWETGVDM